MTNILLFLICVELAVIIVTKIVMLTKIGKVCNIVVMIKNAIGAIYELFGGIVPEMEIFSDELGDPSIKTEREFGPGGLE